MHVTMRGVRFIARFEGFPNKGCPYRDPVGIWTRGYGRTKGIGPRSGCITREQAMHELIELLRDDYEPAINALKLPLTAAMFDALASFAFNLGTNVLTGNTGIGRALREHRWHDAADEMLRWNHSSIGTLPGLTRRRRAERALFLSHLPETRMRKKRLFPVTRTARRLRREHPELMAPVRASLAHILAHWPRLQITSTTGGQHAPNSLHPHGQAADLGVPLGERGAQEYMDRAAAWIASRPRLRRQLYEAIHQSVTGRIHLSVKNGAEVPHGFWGPETWAGHRNHIHVARRT